MIPIDGVLKAGFIASPWTALHYKVQTEDGVQHHVPADWVIGIKP